MAFKFNYTSTFNSDGYARGDRNVLDALHIKQESNTFHLTQNVPKIPKVTKDYKDNHHKQNPALTIEECKPDNDYREGQCIPLPSNVSENSIFNNIISSFRHNFQQTRDKKMKQVKETFRTRKDMKKTDLYPERDIDQRVIAILDMEEEKAIRKCEVEEDMIRDKLDKKLEAWRSFLKLPQNKYVVSDAFWYMRYHIVPEADSQPVTEFLLGRMAKNYIDLFLSVTGIYKQSFFKNYFNILSQGVFYSFFYACPKSRDELDDKMKEIFLSQFSILFTGIEISNPKDYFSNWYLDLGAGNILKADNENHDENKSSLPQIVFKDNLQLKVVRTKQELRYSPIILTYLGTENYQTRNVVKGYQMNFSKISTDREEVEKRFENYRQIAKKVNQDLKEFKVEDKINKKNLKRELKKLREESWNHQRRLSRRRDEELEKGAHEYANYLVSMLNAHSQNTGIQKI